MPNTAIGWTTLEAANAYFSAERPDSAFWDALLSKFGKDEKTAVLLMAYNRIRFCRDFEIPADPTADQLAKLAFAQHEGAYYLAIHASDEDRRKGLQAQGVAAAGVLKETYDTSRLAKIALPAIVYSALDEFNRFNKQFFAVDIDRDEDTSVSSDPT